MNIDQEKGMQLAQRLGVLDAGLPYVVALQSARATYPWPGMSVRRVPAAMSIKCAPANLTAGAHTAQS